MSNNDIVKNGFNVEMIDTFEHLLKLSKPFILNTDISSGQGIHYITLFKYTPNKIYIIDSLGKNNYRPYDNLMFSTLKKNHLKWTFYPFIFQTKKSNKCGWWAVYCANVIEYLLNNGGFSPEIFEKYMVKIVGKTAELSDEHILINSYGVAH